MKKVIIGLVLGSFSVLTVQTSQARGVSIGEVAAPSSFLDYSGHFDGLTTAFKECLSEGIYNNQTNVKKTGVDGTSTVNLSYDCQSDSKAKALYNAMERFSYSNVSTWSKGNRVALRKNGSLTCYRELVDINGNTSSDYWCILNLDLSNNFIKALDL